MVRPLFASVEELLEPATLSTLGRVAVRSVRRVPVKQADAYSGSRFYTIETNDKTGPRFILKLPPQNSDSPASWDGLNRTVAAWQHGILDSLPPTIEHATLACAHDGAGYAILMQDVGDMLVRRDKRFTVAEHELFLDAMVTMHTAFWEDSQLKMSLSPSPYFLIDPTAEGWDVVEDFLEPDAAQVVRSLLQNAHPLYDALAQYPTTLVHNDLWYANLGIIRGEPPQVVMLDWDFATLAPPAVDLVFYIGENFGCFPQTTKQASPRPTEAAWHEVSVTILTRLYGCRNSSCVCSAISCGEASGRCSRLPALLPGKTELKFRSA